MKTQVLSKSHLFKLAVSITPSGQVRGRYTVVVATWWSVREKEEGGRGRKKRGKVDRGKEGKLTEGGSG